MNSHDDPIDEVERALMQLPYLLAQGIEMTARVRVMRAEQHEHAERSAAEADLWAATDAARGLYAAHGRAEPVWRRVHDRPWTRNAEPLDLFEAWSSATAWQEHDRDAAAAAQRAEGEMRRRWPDQMRLYDDARSTGLSAHEAMRNMVATATNAGWDPSCPARPHRGHRPSLALSHSASVRPGKEQRRSVDETTVTPTDRAMRHLSSCNTPSGSGRVRTTRPGHEQVETERWNRHTRAADEGTRKLARD